MRELLIVNYVQMESSKKNEGQINLQQKRHIKLTKNLIQTREREYIQSSEM